AARPDKNGMAAQRVSKNRLPHELSSRPPSSPSLLRKRNRESLPPHLIFLECGCLAAAFTAAAKQNRQQSSTLCTYNTLSPREETVTEPQKTAVIFGLANKRSIAWAIAQKLQQAGWRLAITYQNERLALEAKDLIADLAGADGFMCDVTQDHPLAPLFAAPKEKYGVLHGLVHSIGFPPEADLKGDFVNTTREGFRIAHDISVYSLIAVSRGALPLMTTGGGIVTLTYYGAEKVVPRYNVMGVAKAALEATVRYLANDLGP